MPRTRGPRDEKTSPAAKRKAAAKGETSPEEAAPGAAPAERPPAGSGGGGSKAAGVKRTTAAEMAAGTEASSTAPAAPTVATDDRAEAAGAAGSSGAGRPRRSAGGRKGGSGAGRAGGRGRSGKATAPKGRSASAAGRPKEEAKARKRPAPRKVAPLAEEPAEPELVEPELVEPEEGEVTPEVFGLDAEVEEAEILEETPRPGRLAPLPLDDEHEVDEEEQEPIRALSRTDPLARYMQEVARHPILSREEEHELAVRYHQTGDLDAAYRLVASNLRLVVKIAYEYRRAAFNVLDLIQEGNVGLMNAVKKYDPFKGVKLSTYAAWWIRAYILRFIMDNWRMVKLGTTQAQRKLFFNLRKEQAKLAAEGFDPGPRLLAERLNVSEQEVVEMDQRLGGDELSIDTPVSEDANITWGERLALPAPPADERLGQEELKQLLREELRRFAETLDGRERYIFEHRMIADDPMTLQEIGDHFGFSRERARQIEAKLVQQLRERLRERMPDFDTLLPDSEA